jgi:non-ribosomal peptide synthetase component F
VNCCLHDILAEQVCLTPHAEAICAWDGAMTYEVLDAVSTQLGHYLVDHGNVRARQRAGFAFEKSLKAIFAMICYVDLASYKQI